MSDLRTAEDFMPDAVSKAGEEVLYQARPSWLYYYRLYLIAFVLFAILQSEGRTADGIRVALFFLGLAAILRYRYKFVLSGERVISRVGLIARNTNEMKVRHIRSILVRQNPVERILGIGTVIMISAADGISTVTFKGIAGPVLVKEAITGMNH